MKSAPLLAFAALMIGGCNDGTTPSTPAKKSDQLQSVAERMKDDPDASPEARKIATGVLRQTEQQKQLDSFANGN